MFWDKTDGQAAEKANTIHGPYETSTKKIFQCGPFGVIGGSFCWSFPENAETKSN
jgi:hypothetical protein